VAREKKEAQISQNVPKGAIKECYAVGWGLCKMQPEGLGQRKERGWRKEAD